MKKRVSRGGKAVRLHADEYEALEKISRLQGKSIAEMASIAVMAQLAEWDRAGEIRIPLKKRPEQK
jgi:hypothetical protein